MKIKYPHIFWIACVVHTLNLALNIYVTKNIETDVKAYAQCSCISEVSNDALIIKNFIMNHSIRLAMFNDYSKMNLLAVAETRFVVG